MSTKFDLDDWNIQDVVLLNHQKEFDALFKLEMRIDDRNNSRYIISVSRVVLISFGFCLFFARLV